MFEFKTIQEIDLCRHKFRFNLTIMSQIELL